MPAFRGEASDLRELGPRLSIVITPDGSDARSAPVPLAPGVRVVALVDTGSGRSLIQPAVARELRVPSVGRVQIDTPSSTDLPAREFDVRFWFDSDTSVAVRALEAPLPVSGIRAVIGRDLLAAGTFSYDGRSGAFLLDLAHEPLRGRAHRRRGRAPPGPDRYGMRRPARSERSRG